MLCMDSHLGPLLVLMIETPHPVHTHSRSSLYIYKVFEHLQQWLRVIRVSLQPDICSHGPKSDVVHGFALGSSCCVEMYGYDQLDGLLRANALSALVRELCACSEIFRTLVRTPLTS